MAEMHDWEERCAQRTRQCMAGAMSFEDAEAQGVAEYMQIFGKYCSPSKALPRDFHYTEPPDYDSTAELIESERERTPDLFEIRTQQTFGHRKRHLYLLSLQADGWRLFAKKLLLDGDETLDSCL